MKEQFKECVFRRTSLHTIQLCNKIIDEYLAAGLRLTLRQLYYQLVTTNAIKNEEKSYKHLSTLVSDARLDGRMDWNAIEDRVRQPRMASEFNDLGELVDAAVASYRLPRWKGQKYYAELWVEKDALAGVLTPLSRQFHVTLMVNRGYSSQTAMYEAGKRFLEHADVKPILFYLGDHDPSGEDMVRDIEERLVMFGVKDIDVRKIALTMTQIKKYNPPPNPAKISDPRAKAYIAQHGNSSWEVDALPPKILNALVIKAFTSIIDKPKMDKIKAQEERDKKELRGYVEK